MLSFGMAQLLIVDDDADILALLERFFRQHGYGVAVAADGAAMMARLDREPVDLVILDVMLPGEDGFSLCRRLRQASRVPVIMLTAQTETVDRIVGLELGSDDYLTKPFDARELLARVRAVLRRTGGPGPAAGPAAARPAMLFSGWRLDLARRELRSADETLIPLSSGEFDLLLAFAEHPGRVLTRDQLLDLARGRGADAFDRSIDVQVSRLRRKIEVDPRNPELIKTVRQGGYMFTPAVRRS